MSGGGPMACGGNGDLMGGFVSITQECPACAFVIPCRRKRGARRVSVAKGARERHREIRFGAPCRWVQCSYPRHHARRPHISREDIWASSVHIPATSQNDLRSGPPMRPSRRAASDDKRSVLSPTGAVSTICKRKIRRFSCKLGLRSTDSGPGPAKFRLGSANIALMFI